LMPDIEAIVRPNGTIDQNDFAFDVSELLVNIRFEMPLKFGLDSLTLSSNQAIGFSNIDKIKNIKKGQLILKLINDFPINARLKMIFKDEAGTQLFELFTDDSYEMAAAEVDPLSGKTQNPTESELLATLSREECDQLPYARSVEFSVFLNTDDAKRYSMFSDYSIKAKLITDFIYENSL